ncbi:MAG: translation initiation factor Sui1 [Myxococcales bacterium]|nr:translation initiation factor Sui1 [Myxococcales bacterium]
MGRRDDGLVYSNDRGRICPRCSRPVARCTCTQRAHVACGDGIARVRRETKGRRGKTVTTVSGLALPEEALRELAAELKRRCGSGGSAKDGVIEIQGDHRDALVADLESRGYTVKRAGG